MKKIEDVYKSIVLTAGSLVLIELAPTGRLVGVSAESTIWWGFWQPIKKSMEKRG